jgi:glutathione S-transferase
MRARMALVYSETTVELREILLKDKPQSMLEYSTKGTVPVLVANNQVIEESLDVMKWALGQKDKDHWFHGLDDKTQKQILDLIDKNDNEFKPILDHYKYSDRHPESEEHYRDQSLNYLQELDQRLTENKYLFGDTLTLADIAIFPFIRQYAFVNKKWFDATEYTALQRWLQKLLTSELFLSVMQKYKPWKDEEFVKYQPFIKESI